MNVLVIAAHPDDEVLGCGGTIAKQALNGDEVYVLILGEGITSRYKQREEVKSKEIEKLRQNALKASKILGVRKTFFLNFPDNRFDTAPLLDIVKTIEDVVEKIKPEIIYTHHYGDLNIDHKITFEAVMIATRPLPDNRVKRILSFEVPSSTEWAVPLGNSWFTPSIFVDISTTLKKKIDAMKSYKSELKKYPHPRSSRGIEIFAKYRGLMVGKEACEGFELIRDIQ